VALAGLAVWSGPTWAAQSEDPKPVEIAGEVPRSAALPGTGRTGTSVQAQPATLILNEDFGLGFPPPFWTVTTANASYSWIQGSSTYGPLDGDALVDEDPLHAAQNEWLKTSTLNLSGGYSQVLLNFHFKMSYARSISPENLQDLQVWISTDGGTTWPTKLWDESNEGVFPNYVWIGAEVDLTAYLGKTNVKLAFRSVGLGGGPVDVDLVQVATFRCGDLNGDQILTTADVIVLVNYVFKGGAPPDPPSAADMNNNGIVNSSDIVYLVNHVFKGGPPPPCP
jgi:hypothetical protein